MTPERGSSGEVRTLAPERELRTSDGYRWFVYAFDRGVRQICLEDLETGVVVTTLVYNTETRVAAHRAWSGARQSRASGTPWEIVAEMGQKGVDPDEKLEQTFVGYGHASVGDMARIQVDLTRVPMHLAMALFNNTAINDGQEKSTRFQRQFGGAVLSSIANFIPENVDRQDGDVLEREYEQFGELSLELFAKHRELLTKAFTEFYQPSTERERSSLGSRVLDCARYFLLLGQNTGFSLGTSVRDWSRMIGEMKASPLPFYRRVASQVERLLSPTTEEEEYLGFLAEAPSLIRHTESQGLVNENIVRLRTFITDQTDLLDKVNVARGFQGLAEQRVDLMPTTFTEGERLVAQYLLIVWPGLDTDALLEWVHVQSDKTKRKLSGIIFTGHTHQKELPVWAATTRMTVRIKGFLGELRDWNRHRAWTRFVPLPTVFGLRVTRDTAQQILAQGFGIPLYLSDIPAFKERRDEFISDLQDFYRRLYVFASKTEKRYGDSIDFSFIMNLLPLAHRVDIWMHGNPKQGSYMPSLRRRPGGHINYTSLAAEINDLLVQSDSYLSGLTRQMGQPDPASRQGFFDRS